MLRGESIIDVIDELIPLLISAIILLSIGYNVYLKSIEYAKERGIVGEY